MKKKLLEHIIRQCINEVLDIVEDKEETVGAPAPPAGGQGTDDTPPVEQPTSTELPSPEVSSAQKPTTGIHFVHPKDPSKLQQMNFKSGGGEGQLERELHNTAVRKGGHHVKVATNTLPAIRNSLKTAAREPMFLYFGKYDPESDEVFLMADKDLNKAKQNSVDPGEVISPAKGGFDPMSAGADDFASRMEFGGRTPPTGIDENTKSLFKEAIRKALSELATKASTKK